MKRIQKAANSASKSICSKCSCKDATLCGSVQRKMCQNAFINGFIKGANNYKEHLWKSADKNPKKNVPLLLFLSNETMTLGNFEGWGYSFGVPVDSLNEKVEVVAWLYIADIS